MLFRDSQIQNQPENTSRFILNMVRNAIDGGRGTITSEAGNRYRYDTNGDIVGSINVGVDETVHFITPGRIVLEKNGVVTVLFEDSCLNFSLDYPVSGVFRIVRGCERVIYFADGYNPDRYYNLDRTSQFTDCNSLSLVPDVDQVNIETLVDATGGTLRYGSYQFVAELLDVNENVIAQSLPSATVYIGDGLNLDTYSAEIGGMPPTTSSINVSIDGINDLVRFVKLYVITRTAGTGVGITAHQTGGLIDVSGGALRYRYGGYLPERGDQLVDFREITKGIVKYRTSVDMVTSNDSLWRLNVSTGRRNYAAMQRSASKIGTRYIVKDTTHNPDLKTEQGDEVKAYGIVYAYRDGTFSPPFHIPGPAPTAVEEEIIRTRFASGSGVSRIRTTPIYIRVLTSRAPGNDRWVDLDYLLTSGMASQITFTASLNNFSDTKVTFLRSGALRFRVQGRKGNISVKIVALIDGVEYSNTILFTGAYNDSVRLSSNVATEGIFSDVPSWRVNNTAKSQGSSGEFSSFGVFGVYMSDELYQEPVNYCDDESYWGSDIAGEVLVGKPMRYHRIPDRSLEPLFGATGVRQIGIEFYNVEYPSDDIVGHFFVSSVYDPGNRTVAASGYMVPYNYINDSGGNSKEDAGRYLHYIPNSFDNDRFTNSSTQNVITLGHLIDGVIVRGTHVKINGYLDTAYSDNRIEFKKFFKGQEGDLQLFGKHHEVKGYTSISPELIVFAQSKNLQYQTFLDEIPNRSASSNFNIIELSNSPFTFEKERANLNYTYVKTGLLPFVQHAQIRYRQLGPLYFSDGDQYQIFDGDVFISRVDLTNLSKVFQSSGSLLLGIATIGLSSLFDKKQINIEYEKIEGLYFESLYNYERRFEGTIGCSKYYNLRRSIDQLIIERIAERIDSNGTKDWVLRDSICPEFYGCNRDYNYTDALIAYIPLGLTFDYCSSCLNNYITRIIYSQIQTIEDNNDRFFSYKPLDYIDLPSSGGAIVKGDLVGDKVIVRCVNKSFILFPNAQELRVEDVKAYLGSGEYLGVPPVELTNLGVSYGGQQHKWSSALTPQGLFWVDQHNGKVFSYDGSSFTEVSRAGLYWFFDEALRPGTVDSKEAPIVVYNPMYELVMVSWRAFRFIGDRSRFEVIGRRYYVGGNEVFVSDKNLFENLSFTISYNPQERTWESFHSYHFNYAYHSNRILFTVYKGKAYSHDSIDKVCFFYGKSHYCSIERHYASAQTFQHAAFHYYANFQQFNVGSKVWHNVNRNFEEAWAYTPDQSSGYVELFSSEMGYELASWETNRKSVIVTDGNSRIAALRDISTATPVMSKGWVDRRRFYDDDLGFADVGPLNVDYNRELSDQNLFRDKVMTLRLLLKSDIVRVLFHFGIFNNNPSNR